MTMILYFCIILNQHQCLVLLNCLLFSISTWQSTISFMCDVGQGVGQSLPRSRAALKYILLAVSGNMDDVLAEYKVIHLSFPDISQRLF